MALSELDRLIDSFGYLAEAETAPQRWALLSRLRRLYDLRFRDPFQRARPPMAVVLGGTNTGKSTVFNLLLGHTVARALPTPVATKSVVISVERTWQPMVADEGFLPGWHKLPWGSPDDSVQAFEDDAPRLFLHLRDDGPALALADTPDIDSVRRFNEREAEDLFYLADALIYVTSEQKYADEACTEYLRRAVRFDKPVLAVLNRSAADGAAFADFAQVKLPGVGVTEPAAVLALPWLNVEDILTGASPAPPAVAQLRGEVAALAARGPELVAQAARGAARGLADEVEAALVPLEAEIAQLQAWRQQAGAVSADAVRAYQPNLLDPDDVDQAVLEALAEMRVPGLDWIYDQLGVVGQKVGWAARLFGRRLSGAFGRPPRLLEQVEGERAVREADQVKRLLAELQAELRRTAQGLPGELRAPLLARLTDYVGAPLDRLVDEWQACVEAARQAIIAEAKAQILHDLKARGLVIRGFKAATRTASMAVSVAIALHTGQVGVHDLAVAPAADALTKIVLDKALGESWRLQLQREVDKRRREVFAAWLDEVVLQPTLERLPLSHRAGFAAELRAAVAALTQPGD